MRDFRNFCSEQQNKQLFDEVAVAIVDSGLDPQWVLEDLLEQMAQDERSSERRETLLTICEQGFLQGGIGQGIGQLVKGWKKGLNNFRGGYRRGLGHEYGAYDDVAHALQNLSQVLQRAGLGDAFGNYIDILYQDISKYVRNEPVDAEAVPPQKQQSQPAQSPQNQPTGKPFGPVFGRPQQQPPPLPQNQPTGKPFGPVFGRPQKKKQFGPVFGTA